MEFWHGRHYWEVKIEKSFDQEDIYIGVAKGDIDLQINPIDNLHFYGYMPLAAQKFGPNGHSNSNYGQNAQ